MSSTAFQTLKRIPDSPNFFEDVLPLREDFFWAYPKVFISLIFLNLFLCHEVGTQHKLIQGDKTARVNFLPNKVQRWLIKGLLETRHYSHFGWKTLTEKHNYVLNFSLMWLQAEVMLRFSPTVWGLVEQTCQWWYSDSRNSANSGIRVNSN